MKTYNFTWESRLHSQFTKDEAINAGIPLNVITSTIFQQEKNEKLKEINNSCQAELNALTANYPTGEVSTFDKQEAESVAFISDNTAETPLIDALSTAREMDKTELANRVVAKAGLFSAASGAIIGKRQKLEDTLNALSEENNTIDDIAAITW